MMNRSLSPLLLASIGLLFFPRPVFAHSEEQNPARAANATRSVDSVSDKASPSAEQRALDSSVDSSAYGEEPDPDPPLGQDSGQPPVSMPSPEPRLQIRGFSDVRYIASDGDSTNSFALGQFNLFITSRLSNSLSVLAEVVTEADSTTNEFSTELERLLLNYRQSAHLNLGFGRYHTAIGFYNTAYHHSAWLQTTVDRPFLFEFEDDGGILPIHNVGVTATGSIPSGPLGLHYVGELGNGRASRTNLGQDPVQNETDENAAKAFNLALFARPDAIPDLQLGTSFYRDRLTPPRTAKLDESIFSVHVVYQRPTFEFLNEVVQIRHRPDDGTPVFRSTGFYTQLSKRWGRYRPYFRYEYLDVPGHDPVLPAIDRFRSALFGLRYEWGDYAALKVEYDRQSMRTQPSFGTLVVQAAFTF